ncbi:MAG TPA: response regulator, partial [Chthoniobacterales bacterium]
AINFTPRDGRISLRSHDAAPGTLGIEIADTGSGMDPEMMPRLFSAFEQGHTTGAGLGLGLTICKAIVELHGGKISAANRRDPQGAVFTIELKTISTEAETAAPPEKPSTAPGRRLRILFVEDHDTTATVMSKLLQRDGHDVTTAATVRDALALAKTREFDLLLSDLGLPDGNGFQVMREVARRQTKGIAVSGYGMEEDLARSSQAGFSAHLTKPINVQELQETIQLVTSEW